MALAASLLLEGLRAGTGVPDQEGVPLFSDASLVPYKDPYQEEQSRCSCDTPD
jgi:hypothetical protein